MEFRFQAVTDICFDSPHPRHSQRHHQSNSKLDLFFFRFAFYFGGGGHLRLIQNVAVRKDYGNKDSGWPFL